jgi:hypothetical protein
VKRSFKKFTLPACAAAMALGQPGSLLACATCFGASDSPLAQGMNWGILTLLLVVFTVLSGIVGFFVHLGWRSRTASDSTNR